MVVVVGKEKVVDDLSCKNYLEFSTTVDHVCRIRHNFFLSIVFAGKMINCSFLGMEQIRS